LNKNAKIIIEIKELHSCCYTIEEEAITLQTSGISLHFSLCSNTLCVQFFGASYHKYKGEHSVAYYWIYNNLFHSIYFAFEWILESENEYFLTLPTV
jgi:hypothetical protein